MPPFFEPLRRRLSQNGSFHCLIGNLQLPTLRERTLREHLPGLYQYARDEPRRGLDLLPMVRRSSHLLHDGLVGPGDYIESVFCLFRCLADSDGSTTPLFDFLDGQFSRFEERDPRRNPDWLDYGKWIAVKFACLSDMLGPEVFGCSDSLSSDLVRFVDRYVEAIASKYPLDYTLLFIEMTAYSHDADVLVPRMLSALPRRSLDRLMDRGGDVPVALLHRSSPVVMEYMTLVLAPSLHPRQVHPRGRHSNQHRHHEVHPNRLPRELPGIYDAGPSGFNRWEEPDNYRSEYRRPAHNEGAWSDTYGPGMPRYRY